MSSSADNVKPRVVVAAPPAICHSLLLSRRFFSSGHTIAVRRQSNQVEGWREKEDGEGGARAIR
eukprot:2155971-Rhodomonas_salina.3